MYGQKKYGKKYQFRPQRIKTIPINSMNINDKFYKKEKYGKKVRNPVKYLVEKHGIPKRYAEQFLSHPTIAEKYWKKDNSGRYINRETLDSIAYGWRERRSEFKEILKPPISKSEQRQMQKDLFPSFRNSLIPKDLEDDPFVRKYLQKREELKQQLDGMEDKASKIREIKKLWSKAIKDLIKKYPKDKAKIERLFKKQLEMFDIRIRLAELTEIGTKRHWTKKESKELENLSLRMKKLDYA